MRIMRIEIYQVDLPFSGGTYHLSGGRSYTSFDATFARVICDDGTDGWGESTPFGGTYIAAHGKGVRAGLDDLAPALLGLDPRQHDRIFDAMDSVLLGHAHARTPLDVACWDIHGKSTGQPLCDLLGGRVDRRIPLISSLHASPDPEDMRARAADLRARGFRGHSIKVGASEAEGGPMLDAERVRACLADRQPGEWFLVDANGGMSVEHALRFLNLTQGLDFVLEAPCATWRETLSLRARSTVPILLDELIQSDADLIHAIHSNACDGVGLKISKQGGITPTLRQRTIAQAAGLVSSVQDTVGSDIAFAAILHMAQSSDPRLMRMALDTRSMVSLGTAAFDAPIRGGGVVAPDAPGLGITPDMDVLGTPIAIYE